MPSAPFWRCWLPFCLCQKLCCCLGQAQRLCGGNCRLMSMWPCKAPLQLRPWRLTGRPELVRLRA